MKICTTCKDPKDLNDFHNDKTRIDGKGTICKTCRKDYIRGHYLRNKQYYIDKAAVSKTKLITWFQELKATLKCELCPENHPACLDFHHKDKEDKILEVSIMVKLKGKSKILTEIKKCRVLCSNCHRKLHYDERQEGSL